MGFAKLSCMTDYSVTKGKLLCQSAEVRPQPSAINCQRVAVTRVFAGVLLMQIEHVHRIDARIDDGRAWQAPADLRRSLLTFA